MSTIFTMNRYARSLVYSLLTKPSFSSSSSSCSSSSSLLRRFGFLPSSSYVTSGGEGSFVTASRKVETMNLKTNICSPYALGFSRVIHSTTQKEDETGRPSSTMDFVRGIIEEDSKRYLSMPQNRYIEQDVDFVHIKLLRNNTFLTVTDSKGNKMIGASSGCLPAAKGGASRYAAEATAEHIGRLSRSLGLKSVVMKVKGFTHFRKKKQAILGWRDGFSSSRGDQNPIVYIEDTTRKAHNGCRLPKRRRI